MKSPLPKENFGYLGDMKFSGPEGGKIKTAPNKEDWLERATNEFNLAVFSIPVLNANDDELEKLIRDSGDPETWIEFMENCDAQSKRYEDGMKIMDSVFNRLAVVIERIMKEESAH